MHEAHRSGIFHCLCNSYNDRLCTLAPEIINNDVDTPGERLFQRLLISLCTKMATMVLAEGARQLVPAKDSAEWTIWAAAFGGGLRKTLLLYRDGARMVAGSRLTNTEYMKTVERVGARLIEEGLTVRQTVVLLSTIYNYTLSFVMEEQAVFPRPNERSPKYDIAMRNAKLDPKEFPILRQSAPILFAKFDRRYKEGLDLILCGAKVKEIAKV
jgi:TetR/AcrR family transcriptional regulator, tetracycline repressor protein